MSVASADLIVLRQEPATTQEVTSVPNTARRRKAAVVAADIFAIAVALGLSALASADSDTSVVQRLAIGGLALPIWVIAFNHYRLYASQSVYRRPDEVGRIVHAGGLASLSLVFAAFMLRMPIGRSWPLLSFSFGVVTVLGEREIVRRVFRSMRRSGRLMRPVVVVGANLEALSLVNAMTSDRSLGYRVAAVVDDGVAVGSQLGPVQVLGAVDDLFDVVQMVGATGVVIAATAIDVQRSNIIARTITEAGIHVEISSSLVDIAPERLCVQPLGRFPVVYVRPVRNNGWRARLKRVFDLVVSLVAIVLTLPVMILIALIVKLDSPGPALFRQERVGRDGQPFNLVKFRSMVVDAEVGLASLLARNESDGPLFKIRDDPRITRVGRIIRRLSLDELPQLLNVLRGDMSLVGPRPALPRERDAWQPELHNRLRVKPGITGMWQVSGRSDLSFDDYARLDLYYVDNWSLWTDVAILAKTVPAVLLRRGVS